MTSGRPKWRYEALSGKLAEGLRAQATMLLTFETLDGKLPQILRFFGEGYRRRASDYLDRHGVPSVILSAK